MRTSETRTTQGTLLYHMKMTTLYEQSDQIWEDHKKRKIKVADLAEKHMVTPRVIRTLIDKYEHERLKEGLERLHG